jgi:hypothetical protein
VTGNRANGKRDILDLEAAAKAAAKEGSGEPFPFAYKGLAYEIPPTDEWPVDTLAKLADGDLNGTLTDLLGAEAYRALCGAGLKLAELNVLFEALAKDAGMESLPNSSLPARLASART